MGLIRGHGCDNSPGCSESLLGRAHAAPSSTAKRAGPIEHCCQQSQADPGGWVLPLWRGAGKALHAAGTGGRLCVSCAQTGQHRQLFPKGGTKALCRACKTAAAGNSSSRGDVSLFLQPCLPQCAWPTARTRYIVTTLIPLHIERQSSPHPCTHRGICGNIPWYQQGGFP